MPVTAPLWDPARYLRHAGPAPGPSPTCSPGSRNPRGPARIADLGCGAGDVTALPAERRPAARITGYDNSPETLAKARADHEGPSPGGGLDLAHADVRTWTPEEPYGLIVGNAALQGVPGHVERFRDWIAGLAPRGVPSPPRCRAPSTPPAAP